MLQEAAALPEDPMAKYARKKDGHFIDVFDVPGQFPTLEKLNQCLPGGGFMPVHDGVEHGAAHNGGNGTEGTYTNPTPPPAPPSEEEPEEDPEEVLP